MSGFQFSLKGNKVSKPSQKPFGFGLNKKPAQQLKKNVLSNGDDEDDEPKKTSIDAFDLKKGALAGENAIGEKKQLIIIPTRLSTGLIPEKPKVEDQKLGFGLNIVERKNKPDQEVHDRKVPENPGDDEIARKSLLDGRSIDGGLTIEIGQKGLAQENTEKDYEEIPVEQFGAALLRGMGWKGDNSGSGTQNELSHRQRGAVLGIGSKPIEREIEAEIMGKRGTKLNVPLLKRDKRTGEQLRVE